MVFLSVALGTLPSVARTVSELRSKVRLPDGANALYEQDKLGPTWPDPEKVGSVMSSETVTLALDGAPTIGDFAAGVQNMRGILSALSSGTQIEWVIDMLDAGSAIVTVRGVAEDMGAVDRVAVAYLGVGRSLQQNTLLPHSVAAPATRLRAVITDRVPSIRFETADDDVTISVTENTSVRLGGASDFQSIYGAVEGRVQTITNRGSLRFTLYDLLFDKAVSCYLAPGYEDIMSDAWGHIAVVEGLVKRDPVTGRPTTVRQVTQVHVIRDEGVPGQWRTARGALAGFGDERAEMTIRRIRDAQ